MESQVPIATLIAEGRAALLNNDTDAMARVAQAWQGQVRPHVPMLDVLAQFELQNGQPAQAADRLNAAQVFSDGSRPARRAHVNALIQAGQIDLALRKVHELGPASENIHHLLWSMALFLRGGQRAAAEQALAEAVASGRCSATDLQCADARLMAAEGREESARQLLRECARQEPGNALVQRLLAQMSVTQGDYPEIAVIHARLAQAERSVGDLREAVRNWLFLGQVAEARAAVAAFRALVPSAEAEVVKLTGELDAEDALVARLVQAFGPLLPLDIDRVLTSLTTNVGPDQVLWGRRALVQALRMPGAIDAEAAERLVRPFANFEDGRINRFLPMSLNRAGHRSATLRLHWLRVLSWDAGNVESILRSLAALQPTELDEEISVYAVWALRWLSCAPPRVREALAPLETQVREVLAGYLPQASATFRQNCHAHLDRLGLAVQPLPRAADWHESLEKSVGYTRPLWQEASLCRVAGWPSRGGRQPRPVVALSGQYRGFDRAWPSIHEGVVDALRAPVVMSVWDKTRNAEGRHASRLERAIPPEILRDIPAAERYTDLFARQFPKTHASLFREYTVDVDHVEQTLRRSGVDRYVVETESEATFEACIRNLGEISGHRLLKMYAKFARLEQLIAGIEADTGELFSHVFWIRPDARLAAVHAGFVREAVTDFDNPWGQAARPTTVGDYLMVFPRQAFRALAAVFPQAVIAGNMRFAGMVPTPFGESPTGVRTLRGPEGIAQTLFAQGYFIREMSHLLKTELVGFQPPLAQVMEAYRQDLADRAAARPAETR